MSQINAAFKYSKEHEWVEVLDGGKVRIGITDFAQHQLGDIVFVEVPEQDQRLKLIRAWGRLNLSKPFQTYTRPCQVKF
jgi:glycine cleavage system H protein